MLEEESMASSLAAMSPRGPVREEVPPLVRHQRSSGKKPQHASSKTFRLSTGSSAPARDSDYGLSQGQLANLLDEDSNDEQEIKISPRTGKNRPSKKQRGAAGKSKSYNMAEESIVEARLSDYGLSNKQLKRLSRDTRDNKRSVSLTDSCPGSDSANDSDFGLSDVQLGLSPRVDPELDAASPPAWCASAARLMVDAALTKAATQTVFASSEHGEILLNPEDGGLALNGGSIESGGRPLDSDSLVAKAAVSKWVLGALSTSTSTAEASEVSHAISDAPTAPSVHAATPGAVAARSSVASQSPPRRSGPPVPRLKPLNLQGSARPSPGAGLQPYNANPPAMPRPLPATRSGNCAERGCAQCLVM